MTRDPDRPSRQPTSIEADPSVAHLSVSRILVGDPGQLWDALADPSWLGRPVDRPADQPELRQVETDLAFNLAEEPRTLTFRKAALVALAPRWADDGSCEGVVQWRASTFAPLFPVFSGVLTVHDGGLHLDGVYAPPGGQLGLLVDRSLLQQFARRTAIWFLDRLSQELASRPPGGA
jgi:hypothetical protein